jgi:curved DNA-binding protein CbpA
MPAWEARLEVDAYYALLECTEASTPEEISKLYRRLSLRV